LRQRINLAACALKSGFVSSPIRETLASRVFHGKRRTLTIIEAKRHAVIVAEIVLRQVAMQMLLFAVLINAPHTALENQKVAFRRIGVYFFAMPVADIFLDTVFHGLVRVEGPADLL
jgi:hypothetical protein